MKKAWAAFAVLLALQAAFWWHGLDHKPRLEVVPNVPGEVSVKAISFGDSQAFFRVLGLQLQSFGDTFGRYTPLKDYDYARLEQWFTLLDRFDDRSNFIPSMATYYFSQSQNPEHSLHVIRYLQAHAKGRLKEKWWWQAQAVYLAQHKLKDPDLALELALPLVHEQGVPLWVNQLAAFIYEKRGEFDSALGIINEIQKNIKEIPPNEIKFMEYFVKERLGALDRHLEKQ